MKTPNSLEDQMRSWTPRRPAAQIEQQLFGARNAERETRNSARPVTLPWFQTLGASVVGCAVVLFTILNFLQLGATQNFSGALSPLSNHPTSLALASAPINTWTAPILGWTNDGTVSSSTRPFNVLNTNSTLP
jgi:hypothetical protein